MIKFEKLRMPAASLGEPNPLPDIKNVSYIHAGYEMTERVSEQEKKYIGKGMITTLLPYQLQDGYDRDKQPRDFEAAVLENGYLRAVFLPELGGRLWSLYDKKKERELLYVNPVFQPGNLGLRNAWFSGGVEFNVGIKGHNPLTCAPLWCAVDTTPEGQVLRLYEYERIRGVVYSISAFLPEDSEVLYLKCRIENTEAERKHMYWWSNIAVPETESTRVLVPVRESFLCFYNADHYVLDKTAIPVSGGIDVSYPTRIPSSRDFFYKIPPEHFKWIATADEAGHGLLQCSTRELFGRKLFVWGMGQGGRHWNEWLSEEGSSYIEIQAGLAHTQLEHVPMEGNTAWEWVEAYTALEGDAAVLHGDYQNAVGNVEQYMLQKVGDPNGLTFPDTVLDTKIVFCGSDWGALEQAKRGERISDLPFPARPDEETAPWWELLEKGTFPTPDISEAPKSYAVGDFWCTRLEALKEKSWFAYLHIGVARYESGDIEGAKKAWEDSLTAEVNPWALRNLAMLEKNELGNTEAAAELILKAFALKKDEPALIKEVAATLTAAGRNEEWLAVFDSLSNALKSKGRLRLYRAIALIALERLEQAADIINADFVMSDIKEGELSVSHLWFELYRRLYAKETGVAYDPKDAALIAAADEKYPLPRSVDFRMHD